MACAGALVALRKGLEGDSATSSDRHDFKGYLVQNSTESFEKAVATLVDGTLHPRQAHFVYRQVHVETDLSQMRPSLAHPAGFVSVRLT
jgi:hypothetical protein